MQRVAAASDAALNLVYRKVVRQFASLREFSSYSVTSRVSRNYLTACLPLGRAGVLHGVILSCGRRVVYREKTHQRTRTGWTDFLPKYKRSFSTADGETSRYVSSTNTDGPPARSRSTRMGRPNSSTTPESSGWLKILYKGVRYALFMDGTIFSFH